MMSQQSQAEASGSGDPQRLLSSGDAMDAAVEDSEDVSDADADGLEVRKKFVGFLLFFENQSQFRFWDF